MLSIGDGKMNSKNSNHDISIPQNFCNVVSSLEELIDQIYPHISENYKNKIWLWERAILAPLNEDVNYMNDEIQKKKK